MSDPSQLPANVASEAVFRDMRAQARDMFSFALAECDIARAFSHHVSCNGGQLRIGRDVYDLESFSRTLVVAIGKAAHPMVEALADTAGAGLLGVVASSNPAPAQVFGFRYFSGGHPLPNQDSLRAGDAILKLLAATSSRTLVIYCLSGGASAIAEKPIHDTITLPDLVETYKALVHSGAPIAEINAIRKHLSALKGGRLAQAAAPAFQTSIMVSDVPDKSLDALASGPSMPDSTTVADCRAIVQRYRLLPKFPANVRALFEQHRLSETPKPGEATFERSRYTTVLSNATAEKAAVERAVLGGFAVEVDDHCDDWNYQAAADYLLTRLRQLRRGVSRACLISGGEVTVEVGGRSGVGGRNQQFALYCAQKIAGENITVLSAGTDGIDGNSNAAGGVVDGITLARAQFKGLDITQALTQFDAYPVLDALGQTVVTGATRNNVRDLRILLAY